MSAHSQSIIWKTISRAKEEKAQVQESIGMAGILNICLIGAVCFMLTYYIIQANILAANGYKMKVYSDQLAAFNETNTSLVSKVQSVTDTLGIANFAESHGMIQAKNANYIFENGNVALGR